MIPETEMGGSGKGRGRKTPVWRSPWKGIAPRESHHGCQRKEQKATSQDTWAWQLLAFKSGHQTSSVSDESNQSRHKITLVQAISLSDSWGDWRERKTRLDLSFFHLIEATVAEASGAGSVGHSMHIGHGRVRGVGCLMSEQSQSALSSKQGKRKELGTKYTFLLNT